MKRLVVLRVPKDGGITGGCVPASPFGISGRCVLTFAVALFITLYGLPAAAAHPDDIVGKWWSQRRDVQVEIYRQNETYAGRIVWLKEPNYRATDPRGMGGKPRIDRDNPDPAKRTRPILGLTIMSDFRCTGNGHWDQGVIYDPLRGYSWRGIIVLVSPDSLSVRGYLGIQLFGRTEMLTRVASPIGKTVKSGKVLHPGSRPPLSGKGDRNIAA